MKVLSIEDVLEGGGGTVVQEGGSKNPGGMPKNITVYRQIQNISRNYFDPEWAMMLMMKLTKSKEKLTRKILTKIYLQRLLNKGFGTTPVEKMTSKMLGGKRDESIIKQVMKSKVDDAEREEKEAKVECNKCRVEYNRDIIRGDYANIEFENLAKEAVERIWDLKMKNIKKSIKYKSEKSSSRKSVSKNVGVEGIKVTDDDLKDVPKEVEEKAVVYGGLSVSENIEKLMMIHPGYQVYDDMNMESVKTEIEKGMIKVRYNHMNNDKKDVTEVGTPANESETQCEPKIFDIETGVVKYSHKRATEFTTVRRLYPPAPASIEVEATMHSIKEQLLMKTRE